MSKLSLSTHRNTIAIASFLAMACCVLSANSAEFTGTVELGGENVRVKLFEATTERPRLLGRTRTGDSGQFTIASPVSETASIFFVTADVGWGVKLVTVLGPELPAETTINELTTVASSYSMAQFYRTGYISGDAFALRIAAGMNDNIVEAATGNSSEVLLTSPNADETHSLRMTRSLSNLLGAAAENPFLRFYLFYLTRPVGGSLPHNTAEALANLARDPGQNVAWIYFLTKFQDTYSPALIRRPDAWTVTVKVNDSGDDNFLFGGPANVAFDSRGYAWVANNVVQGTPCSAKHIMVLKPNGKPADGGGPGLPTSPISGGGILGVGWGITVDRNDKVWPANFGWGGVNPTMTPPGSGSVSKLDSDGMPLSVPEGFYGGTWRVQGIKSDHDGNMWMSSFGNNKVVVFPGGDPLKAEECKLYDGAAPFGMAIDADGAAWVTNSGGLAGRNQSSVAKFVLNDDGELELEFLKKVGNTLKVIDIDSQGNAWLASQGTNRIYGFRPDGTHIHRRGFTGGGINGPWGLTIDGEDNIWVSNFGPTQLGVHRRGGISKLAGVNKSTRPPGKRVGDPLSPSTGYTVHSAGSQVLLHDGTPLNGENGRRSFTPLMRQTSVVIDRAGNIWSINNWKPRFITDVAGFDRGEIQKVENPADNANPGGDGIIIFVGLAPPRSNSD